MEYNICCFINQMWMDELKLPAGFLLLLFLLLLLCSLSHDPSLSLNYYYKIYSEG